MKKGGNMNTVITLRINTETENKIKDLKEFYEHETGFDINISDLIRKAIHEEWKKNCLPFTF